MSYFVLVKDQFLLKPAQILARLCLLGMWVGDVAKNACFLILGRRSMSPAQLTYIHVKEDLTGAFFILNQCIRRHVEVSHHSHIFLAAAIPFSMLRHSSTPAPTELRRVNIDVTSVHLLSFGSYRSTELSEELPSFPPRAYRLPSICTTSCVDLCAEDTVLTSVGPCPSDTAGIARHVPSQSLAVAVHIPLSHSSYQWTWYLLEFMADMGSQAFLLMLNLSPLDIHMVPSFPPMQYRAPSREATPQLLRRLLIDGTGDHRPIRGSNRSTLAW
jgi:hypothetical protein